MDNTTIDELESTNQEEVYEEKVDDVVEDTDSPDFSEEIEKLSDTNKKLFSRAKKAEEELKELKKVSKNHPKSQDSLSREEIILLSQGSSVDEIEFIKKIAKLEDVSILDAKNSDTFNLYREKEAQKKRAELLSFGSSKGSPSNRVKTVAEMTREEHIAYNEKMMGRIN